MTAEERQRMITLFQQSEDETLSLDDRLAARLELERLMAESGIDFDTIRTAASMRLYALGYDNAFEARLLVQLVAIVTRSKNVQVGIGEGGVYHFALTPEQHSRLILEYGSLRLTLRQELMQYTIGFFHRNGLISHPQTPSPQSVVIPSPEVIRRMFNLHPPIDRDLSDEQSLQSNSTP